MKDKTILALLASGTLLAAPAFAQRWGNGQRPDSGACFYEYPQFRGRSFCARTDEEFAFVPNGMNDRISSIRVFGRAQAIVFSFTRFGGSEAWFDYDVPNLRYEGWEDRVSSLRVLRRPFRNRDDERSNEGRPRGDREGPPPERFREGPPPDSFRDDPPRGRSGYRGGESNGPARVDPVSAEAIVRRAYQDLLHRDPDAGGLQQYRDRILREGWTEQQVRQSIADSPEYRAASTMTREKAQAIVRAAYLAVLKREPDPGSAGWVDRVLQDHWSQQDLENELRKSDEYRAKNR